MHHHAAVLLCACTQALRPPTLLAPRQRSQALRAKTDENYDAVVVGAGVGGLCTAALLARYDRRVLLVEAHEWAAAPTRSPEADTRATAARACGRAAPAVDVPLRQVFDAIGRDADWIQYAAGASTIWKAKKRWRRRSVRTRR